MYQAGVKSITLYENKGINFRYYDQFDFTLITELVSLGAIIEIPNIQRPKFEVNSKFSKLGRLVNEYKIDFFLLGLTNTNLDLISQLSESIYGWCFLVEFYDGTFNFYNVPVYCRTSKIKPHDEMSFSVTLETNVPSLKTHLNYLAGVSGIVNYRFDSEILGFDSEIYTFDYEL